MTLMNLGVGIFLLVITAAGFTFNGYIIFISCTRTGRQNRSASQMLLLHLGSLNLLLELLLVTAFIPAFFQDSWLQNSTCQYIGPLWEFFHVIGLWNLMSLNLDKYITIASPLHYARFVSVSKATFILFITWIFASFIILPPLLLGGIIYEIRSSGCNPNVFTSITIVGSVYTFVTTFLEFLLPILIVAIVNGRILVIASYHRHRIVSALWDVTLSAQATITQQQSHLYLTNYRGRSAATTIIHHVVSLIIIYLPTAVCRIYESSTSTKVHPIITSCCFTLLAVSPAVNGFIYGVKSKVLKKAMVHLLRKQLYKSEMSCEIQARNPSASGSRRPSITPSINLQKQLTRRMSEILIPTSTTISTSSVNNVDSRNKLEGQYADIVLTRVKSGDSIDNVSASSQIPMTKFNPKIRNKQTSVDSSYSESTISQDVTPESLNSFNFNITKNESFDSSSLLTQHNGSHRQSLRRALFARNKQQSLELDMVEMSNKHGSRHPHRSLSHQQVEESAFSPSLIRPVVFGSEFLSPERKLKKVSWSSDSFRLTSDSDHSVKSDPDIEEGTNVHRNKFNCELLKLNGFDSNHCNNLCFNKNEKVSEYMDNHCQTKDYKMLNKTQN